jgi:hypothetical protein
MAELTVPQINFAPLGELGEIYKKSQDERGLKDAFSQGIGSDPQSLAALAQRVSQYNPQMAVSLAQLAHGYGREGVTDARTAANDKFSQSMEMQRLAIAKRAAERADDPTPTGFQKQSDGTYAPLPGGPQDPTYQARLATETARAKGDVPTVIGAGSSVIVPNKAQEGAIFTNKPAADSSLDDQTTNLLAERMLQGDTRALVGLGRGAQGAENILKIQRRAAEIANDKGLGASDILNNNAVQAGRMSESRSLGTKSANFGVAEKAMEESLPIAYEASKNVPRTAYPVLNQLILTGKTNVGDPNVKKFLIATDTAAKDYARTINPSGTTRESDIAYARKILSMSDGPEAYAAALDQLKTEATVTKRAIQRQKEEVKTQGKSEAGHGSDAPSFTDRFKAAFGNPNAAQVTSTGVKWNVEQ